MNKIFTVANTLFTRRIKKPNYYWMIFAPLLLFLIVLLCSHYVQQKTENENISVAIVAPSNIKNEILQQSRVEKSNIHFVALRNASLRQAQLYLNDGSIDSILEIKGQNLSYVKFLYRKRSTPSIVIKKLNRILNTVKTDYLVKRMGLSLGQIQLITSPVHIDVTSIDHVQRKSKQMQAVSELIVIGGFLILTSYISITGSEIGREKGDHLIESILSSISTEKYFAGKILGILFLLIFQLIIYGLILGISNLILPMLHYRRLIDFSFLRGISVNYVILSTLLMIVAILLYIILSAIIASYVSRVEDISQATSSVASLILIPYVMGLMAVSDPDINLVKVLSYVPFASQSIMPVRLATFNASYVEGWFSLFISVFTLIPLCFIASKVYKKNIFKYSNHNLFYNLVH